MLTGETIHTTVLDAREIAYVARDAMRQLVIIDLQLGFRLPA